MISQTHRDLIPDEIVLPCEHTDATITLAIQVGDDGVVRAAGLGEISVALESGIVDLVSKYCRIWTRWLAQAESRPVFTP